MSSPDDATAETETTNGSEKRRRTQHQKQPFLSGGMSILIAGLGQVYNGQYLRGALFIAGLLVIMLVTQQVPSLSLEASAIGVLLHAIAAYDAYTQAQRINEAARQS